MFILTIHDRNGVQLKEGDFVKILDNGGRLTFFAEVKYLPQEMIITPFHTFSFSELEKVENNEAGQPDIPSTAVLSTEERYKIYYLPDPIKTTQENHENFSRFLMDWRQCESHLEKRMWRIKKFGKEL